MAASFNQQDKKLIQESAPFAEAAYANAGKKYALPPGNWIPLKFALRTTDTPSIDGLDNPATGYQARVWINQDTKQIFLANAGTNDKKDVENWSSVETTRVEALQVVDATEALRDQANASIQINQANRILRNVDANHYVEESEWVAANQAILAIDFNHDRQISHQEMLIDTPNQSRPQHETAAQLGERAKIKAHGTEQRDSTYMYGEEASTTQHRD